MTTTSMATFYYRKTSDKRTSVHKTTSEPHMATDQDGNNEQSQELSDSSDEETPKPVQQHHERRKSKSVADLGEINF